MQISESIITQLINIEVDFVLFKNPDCDIPELFIDDENVKTKTDEHFIYCPFDTSENDTIIINNKTKHIEDSYGSLDEFIKSKPKRNFANQSSNTLDIISDSEYQKLILKTIEELEKGVIKKVVMSRIITSKVPSSLYKVFLNLCENHPNAFVHLIVFNKSEIWIGASPEILLQKKGHQFKTMALAGTLKNDDKYKWTNKEKKEQEIVKKYILDKLETLNAVNITVENQETIVAGKIKHLRNIITYQSSSTAIDFVKKLHPTPAIAGIPKEEACLFISKYENHNREYYTGYLGHIKANSETYFVNLRCMKIKNDRTLLFVGGGITKDSDPVKECQETVNKSMTLRDVILPLSK